LALASADGDGNPRGLVMKQGFESHTALTGAIMTQAALKGTLPNAQNFDRPNYPSKAHRACDHFKRERIGVKIGAGTDAQANRLTGNHRSLALGALAVLVNNYKG
jgi:hypothetical protein